MITAILIIAFISLKILAGIILIEYLEETDWVSKVAFLSFPFTILLILLPNIIYADVRYMR